MGIFLSAIGDWIGEMFYRFLIDLVAVIYNLVGYLFQIFSVLAETNIFEEQHYQALIEKVYVILGVVVLFIMAYNFLMLVVDPDKNKGGATVEKMLKNIVTSFILIVVTPALFTFAFDIQHAILKSDIINSFFNSNSNAVSSGNLTMAQQGHKMAATVFESFINATDGGNGKDLTNASGIRKYSYISFDGKTTVLDCSGEGDCSLYEVKDAIKNGATYLAYRPFALNMAKGTVDYSFFVALVAGGYLAWVILSFCFDLAVRVCKLAFLQIISPLAISARVIPDNKVFGNWWKNTYSTFISVFIRIFIMNLGLYLIRIVGEIDFFGNNCDGCSFGVEVLGNCFILMGIITFMQAASKLIDEIFGLGGDIKLGLKDMANRLKGGGAYAAGASVGAGITSAAHNASKQYGIKKDLKALKKEGKISDSEYRKRMASAGMSYSVLGGLGSGMVRGLNQGKNASDWRSMRAAASTGAHNQDAQAANNYSAFSSHGGTITGYAKGKVKDAFSGMVDWFTGKDVETLQRESDVLGKFTSQMSRNKSLAEDLVSSESGKGAKSKFNLATFLADAQDVTKSADEREKNWRYIEEMLSLTGATIDRGTGTVTDGAGGPNLFARYDSYLAKKYDYEDLQRRAATDPSITAQHLQDASDAMVGALKDVGKQIQSASMSDDFIKEKSAMFVDVFKEVGVSGTETIAAAMAAAGTEAAARGASLASLDNLRTGKGTIKDFENGAESLKDAATASKAQIDQEIANRKKDEAAKGSDKK